MNDTPVLTLLTRADCHLCDRMLDAVRPLAAAHGVEVTVIDIDRAPALAAVHGERVPVLFEGQALGGVEICHAGLDRGRLEQALSRLAARRETFAPAPKIR